MGNLELWVLPLTVAFGAIFSAAVVWIARRPPPEAPARTRRGHHEFSCSKCGAALSFALSQTRDLNSFERALAVRERPDLAGHRLVEYSCPDCGAAHCYLSRGRKIAWIGANLYQPYEGGATCAECKKSLTTPPWDAGRYDGNLDGAPELSSGYGLVCQKCRAICCIECCEKCTKNRTRDGSLMCPRCFRPPMAVFFHGLRKLTEPAVPKGDTL